MATLPVPVTPQRVRDILSSLVYDIETRTPPTSEKKSKVDLNLSYPITWFAKPPELCPFVCSRFGWENTEYDMLHCTACNANLCGVLPAKCNKAYKKACEALVKKLMTAHEKFCTLAVNPCPEAYLKVGLHDVEELRKNFLQRLSALRRCALDVPNLVYTQLETWGFAESHAAKFCAEESMSETSTPTQVITLAFTGWTLRDSNHQIIVCSLCRRQVGLWNYTPARGSQSAANGNHHDPEDEGDVESSGDCGPPSKMRKIERQRELDPVGSHHAWCPWTALRVPTEDATTLFPNPSPTPTPASSPPPPSTPSPHAGRGQSGDGGRGGCGEGGGSQAAGVGVGGEAGGSGAAQPSSIVEGLHCIRKVLKAWSSPENEKKAANVSTGSITSPS
ncbi:hypothetical protein ACOMHN_028112 [Nucella lapillus]